MEKETSGQKQFFVNVTFVSGLFTGAINKFINHPIDTVKVHLNVMSIDLDH